MKTMNRLFGLTLAAAAALALAAPAYASDYKFTTKAPQDYYGSTSYEEVYGSQYNYEGPNVVDFLDPLADGAPTASNAGSLEYGLSGGSGGIYPDSTGSAFPVEWMESPATAITPNYSAGPAVGAGHAAHIREADGGPGGIIGGGQRDPLRRQRGHAGDPQAGHPVQRL